VENGHSDLRLLTKILRELVTRQRFTEYADLEDAFRRRLNAFQIRYRECDFCDAHSLLQSHVRLVQVPAPRPFHVEPEAVDRGPSRAEATAILRRLGVTV